MSGVNNAPWFLITDIDTSHGNKNCYKVVTNCQKKDVQTLSLLFVKNAGAKTVKKWNWICASLWKLLHAGILISGFKLFDYGVDGRDQVTVRFRVTKSGIWLQDGRNQTFRTPCKSPFYSFTEEIKFFSIGHFYEKFVIKRESVLRQEP